MPSDSTITLEILSRLLLKGITPDLFPELQALPALSPFLPKPGEKVEHADWDNWAAEHFALLGMNVYPNASMYLDESGMLGGQTTEFVLDLYGQFEYTTAEGPDHIGNELAFVSDLSRMDTPESRQRLEEFLSDHLLWWLPVFSHAMAGQSIPFYKAVAREIWTALLDLSERRNIQVDVRSPGSTGSPENPLANPDTKLRDIVRFLLTPIRSGMLLTRDRIATFGRTFRLPRGFGDRLQMLHNLLRTAVDYELIDDLLLEMENEIEGWAAYYENTVKSLPELVPVADFWLRRIESSKKLIREMRLEIA